MILGDEYYKSITDNLSNQEVLSSNKRALHDFYQVIKASDEHLKFVFMTGVFKFSRFSVLNNLHDITMSIEYSTIYGYTQEELENNFKEYSSKNLSLSHDKTIEAIKYWHNGYSLDGEISVYNPFSTLLFSSEKEFTNYWFPTGMPTFLLELVRKHNKPQSFLENITVPSDVFESYDPDNIGELPLLFQTGYLTVKKKVMDSVSFLTKHTLDFPNYELKASFLKYLLSSAMQQISNKKYYKPYFGKKTILLAIAFTGKNVNCKIE